MAIVSRWLAPAVLAAGLGFGALAPAPAQAQDDVLTRVLVDVADVVFNNGVPYYRGNDGDGYGDRLVVARDRYGRPVYYRQVPYDAYYGSRGYDGYGRPVYDQYGRHVDHARYGNGYPYSGNVKCNKHGKCKQTYYDPRYDHAGWDDHHHDYDDDQGEDDD